MANNRYDVIDVFIIRYDVICIVKEYEYACRDSDHA